MATTFLDIPLAYSDTSAGDFTLPEPGVYIVEFMGIVDKKEWPRKDKQGDLMFDDAGNQLMDTSLTCQFVINEPDDQFHGTEFRDYFPARVTSGNKSGRLWAGLLGVKPDELPSPMPRAAEMAGKKAQMTLGHRLGGNGNTYVKIDGVAPMKKRKAIKQVVEDDDEPGF